MSDLLKIQLCGVELKNPVMVASGTFGYGLEYNEFYPISKLGAVCCKGTTLQEREGNPPPRAVETPSGMLNSVGLQNPGVDGFLKTFLPRMLKQEAVVIANIAGNSIEDYCQMAERLNDTPVAMIELNVSCPNVKEGGVNFGTSWESISKVTSEVRKRCRKPLMVKLAPNVTSIGDMAAAAEAAGADAVSLINTITGMRVDIRTRRPMLYNNTGGLSGPAIFPVAVRMVSEVYRRVKIPVVGMGGISTWQDAAEMMIAGAAAIQVGTANFRDPYAPIKIIDGLEAFTKEQGLSNIAELTGTLQLYGE